MALSRNYYQRPVKPTVQVKLDSIWISWTNYVAKPRPSTMFKWTVPFDVLCFSCLPVRHKISVGIQRKLSHNGRLPQVWELLFMDSVRFGFWF